jgi:hypothetical protein
MGVVGFIGLIGSIGCIGSLRLARFMTALSPALTYIRARYHTGLLHPICIRDILNATPARYNRQTTSDRV